MRFKYIILGSGPSGLVMANELNNRGIDDFIVLTTDDSLFHDMKFKGMSFNPGQRTLFYDDTLMSFLQTSQVQYYLKPMNNVGVFFKGKVYPYPLQNNLGGMGIWDRVKILWDYVLRNRRQVEKGNYADWVVGNYGKFLSENIILPHTWKTLKEDLWSIDAAQYGKKVIPMSLLFPKRYEVREVLNKNSVFMKLRQNIQDHINIEAVSAVDIDGHRVYTFSEGEWEYDILVNTISLPKFMDFIFKGTSMPEDLRNLLEVSKYSLRYNNLFIGVYIVPEEFVMARCAITYFPEREYTFSKVVVQRLGEYNALICEMSFRDNDMKLFSLDTYKNKYLEKMENDLKRSGMMKDVLFPSYYMRSAVISPAYIICDEDYFANNIFIQFFLKHNSIFNLGRFAQWSPNLRVEHSVIRAAEILDMACGKEADEDDI